MELERKLTGMLKSSRVGMQQNLQSKQEQSKAEASYFGMPGMLLTLDMYQEPLPTFNIAGFSNVRTHCGGLTTLIIILVLFMFALLKLQHLLSKHNPQVNSFVEKDAFDENDVWTTGDSDDFMMAFTATHFINGEVKNDPKFVKWYAQYVI